MTPRSRSTDKRYYGAAEALVVDVHDPEKEGRVKLQFPWLDGAMISDWCRVAQLFAGNGYGAFWTPELGDEVVVCFTHGDLRLPIVVGGMYNGSDKPPSHRADDKNQKMFKTKGGHVVVLDDSSGQEQVLIKDSSGKNQVLIDTASDQITIEATGGKIVIHAASGVKIQSEAGIEINAAADIKIQAGGMLNLVGATVNIN